MIQLRDYQTEIAGQACALLQEHKIAYLSMQVRTGKTLTALETARLYGAVSVLFLTKKKAIGSIKEDYAALAPGYRMLVTNYEQVENITGTFDLMICDESHGLGQVPVPGKRTVILKKLCKGLPIIYLSGTPTPENYCQIFHQLWVSSFSPFKDYSNFYRWADEYVYKETFKAFDKEVPDYTMSSGATIKKLGWKLKKKDLSEAEQRNILAEIEQVKKTIAEKEAKIQAATAHLFISYTQEEAGFIQDVKEEILRVKMLDSTYYLASRLLRDRIYTGKSGATVLADTEVKLQQKLHQVYSGTVITEGNPDGIVFDTSKAEAILHGFHGQKIAIFYKFKAELAMLQKVFGSRLCFSPEEFRDAGPDRVFCSQIQSGREGINLSTADALVMLNIDFSSVSYQQARARLQSKDRTKECLLYWVFAEGGIEDRIYQCVIKKLDYTNQYFLKDYNIKRHGTVERNTKAA